METEKIKKDKVARFPKEEFLRVEDVLREKEVATVNINSFKTDTINFLEKNNYFVYENQDKENGYSLKFSKNKQKFSVIIKANQEHKSCEILILKDDRLASTCYVNSLDFNTKRAIHRSLTVQLNKL